MLQRLSFILFYSTLGLLILLITFCNGGKSAGNKEKKKLTPQNENDSDAEGNANAHQFLHLIHPHFEQFGTPFVPLEQERDQIIKRNARTKKVEWRLAEINQYTIIREWTSEFSMFDERNAGIEKKVLSPAMTEYANCVKKLEKMKIKNDRTTKIFMLNGAITILEMKQIAGKRHSYRVKYVPEFLGDDQIMEALPTHFCTSLFIVENWKKIGEQELVCTRIGQWTEKDGPPRNIGKLKDCGHSELYDHQLDEHLVNSGAENMLEFVQIKLAMDLTKMLKRIEAANLIVGKKKNHQNQNMPSASTTVADEHQIKKMDPNLRIYKGFMVEYNPRRLVANWLLERLTMKNALSKFSPKRLKWNADPKLAEKFQPGEADYQIAKQFKLNHGHLAGFRAHKNVGQETFLYPNSVPQDREMNSGYWRVIEEYALCLAGHKQSIAYIYTGPLYIPEKNKDTDQWQMKYKVIGKRKMMAVPTHLFKVIFLEFTNNTDGKKSFWLESLVVSNGQRDEGNEEGREEEEAVEEEFEVEEEEEAIQVEIQMGNNEWYILAKDEAEIDKILKESHKPDKLKEKSPEVITVKKTESIQALVKGCQNRSYNIIYGDANSSDKIDELLKRHRVSLAYIDKFAPNFKLLEKLPPKLRSKPYGFHFDYDKLAEFSIINGKGKDIVEELSDSSNEKEEKRNSEEREEEETSHSSIKFGGAKGKGAKRKGGKSKKKKQQQQERKAPASVFHFAEGTINTVEFNSETLMQQFYKQMEELYTEYLLNTKLNYSMQTHLLNSILLYTRWNGALSMLQMVKATMSTEGNMSGAAQINDIQQELFKTKEKRFLEINKTELFGSKETEKLAEINICWLIHLRESIFHTFFSASSQQKSNILLKLEQNRWRNYGILPAGAKGEENILSNLSNDDGKIIAQIWMESADNYCRQNEKQTVDFVFKFKREMHRQQSVTLQKLMKMENIGLTKKFENFFVKNDTKSRIINETNLKLIQLLGVHFFKEFVKEFPNLAIIESSNFNIFHESIFREVIFDIELFVGYQNRKYALQELLQFFDFYTIMNEIEQIPKKYTARIRRKLFHELNNHKQDLIDDLFHCQELEGKNESSPTLRQALAGRCMLDVFCQLQNLFHEINERTTVELDFMNIQGDLHYYGVEECERMIIRAARGRTLSTVLKDKPKLSTDFYENYANVYDESIKNLIKWSFGILDMRMGEIVGEDLAKVEWFMYEAPNTDFEYRKVQLAINQKAETFAFDLQPHLLDTSLVDWQTVQATLVLPSIEKTITHIFADLNLPKKPVMVNLANKEQAVEDALKIVGNAQKFVALEKIFEEISEKSEKMEIAPVHELCQLLFIKQNLLFSMKNIDEKEHKNNPHLQNLIGQIDEIYISKLPYDEEVTVGSKITMESIDGYCQNVEKRQKLIQKYRHVIEILVTKELQDVFFTNSFGMTNYHLMVELSAKLIKMAGIEGFMEIAKKHPLIMTNFFNLKTLDAISYQNDIINNENNEKEGEQKENEKILAEIKIIIMLDLILFQLKLAAQLHQIEETSAGEQENETLLNEKIEKRNKIERAKTEGMDILMEWLDNNGLEKTLINMKTNEKKELHMNKVDQKAYFAIVQLIIGNEENSIPAKIEIGSVTDEKWRREWRKSTRAKLSELEEGKNSYKNGKEQIVEEKIKNNENIASSSASSLNH